MAESWRRWLNPFQSLSPLLMRTTRVDDLSAEIGPFEYVRSESIQCPELMAMCVPPNMRHIQADVHVSPSATVRVLRDLIYSASYPSKNLLLTSDRRFIVESSSTMRTSRHFDWRHAYRRVCERIDGTSFVFRGVSNNYYHTLIDNLPRLMALHHPGVREMGGVSVIVPKKLTAVEEYLFSRLLPSEADVRIVEPDRAYSLERCLFATFATQQFSGFVPESVREWLGRNLLPQRPRRHDRLIYISRAGAAQRRLVNEDEIVDCVLGFGFEVFRLEELTFAEQIELFYDAGCVVGLHGAGFTNLLFSEKPEVIELFPYRYAKPSYYMLAKSVEGIYQPVLGEGERINIDVAVSVRDVKSAIATAIARL